MGKKSNLLKNWNAAHWFSAPSAAIQKKRNGVAHAGATGATDTVPNPIHTPGHSLAGLFIAVSIAPGCLLTASQPRKPMDTGQSGRRVKSNGRR